MHSQNKPSGIYAPVLTPFNDDLSVDSRKLVQHCQWLTQNGVGLALFGTNSEAASLSIGEKQNLLDAVLEAGIPAANLMPGTGNCALSDSVELTRHAVRHGAGGVLMLPPFYYKGVLEEGLFQSYAEIIERVGDNKLRIYLYHIPQVTHVPISFSLIERLLKAYPDTIAGIKDSSGDWSNTEGMLREFQPDGFDVFAGSEIFLSKVLRAGGAGCITATGNVNPKPMVELHQSWKEEGIDAKQRALDEIRAIFQKHPMIPAMKAAISNYRDKPSWGTVRPPLTPLPSQTLKTLLSDLNAADFTMQDLDLSHAS